MYTAHNVFFNKIKLLRFSLKNSKIVAVGDGVKNNLVDIYNIDPSNISTIYNSIEVPDVVVKHIEPLKEMTRMPKEFLPS